MYAVWIKIDETLPWIELKGTYETRKEARDAGRDHLSNAQVKIVTVQGKQKQLKALAIIRR